EPARRGDDDLAVDDAARRKREKQRGVQLGKVAVERPQVAALHEQLGAAAKNDRAKTVPLRLVEKRPGGQRVRQLGEHRLDRRVQRESHALDLTNNRKGREDREGKNGFASSATFAVKATIADRRRKSWTSRRSSSRRLSQDRRRRDRG